MFPVCSTNMKFIVFWIHTYCHSSFTRMVFLTLNFPSMKVFLGQCFVRAAVLQLFSGTRIRRDLVYLYATVPFSHRWRIPRSSFVWRFTGRAQPFVFRCVRAEVTCRVSRGMPLLARLALTSLEVIDFDSG